MAGETHITIEGGLTRDPELKFSASGTAVARFSVAVGSRQKNQDGTWGDGPSAFWDCVAFKQLAENITETLHKGDRVIVIGTLKPEEYTDKEGNQKRVLKVMADNVGPSLLFAKAAVTKVQRTGAQSQNQPQDDPWATSGGSGGWGGGYSDDVPF